MTRLTEAALLEGLKQSLAGREERIVSAAAACCPTCGQPTPSDLRLDHEEYSAYANGGYALLSGMEFALLAALHKSGGWWLPRRAAIDAVWKNRGIATPKSVKNSLANLVSLLRKELIPLELTIMADPNRGLRLAILRR